VLSHGAADAVFSGVSVACAGRGHYDRFVVPPAVPVAASIGVHGDGDGDGGRRGDGDAKGGLLGATALAEGVVLAAGGAAAASARSPLSRQWPFRRRRRRLYPRARRR